MKAKGQHPKMSVREQWAAQQRGSQFSRREEPRESGDEASFDADMRDGQMQVDEASYNGDIHEGTLKESERQPEIVRAKLSADAAPYSRFGNAGKYAPGSAAHANGSFAPVEGLTYYAVYCGAAVALSLVWLAWSRLTLDGSVMGSSAHFTLGMVVLVLILAGGVGVGLACALLSRGRGDMDAGSLFALSFGKTAAAMFVAVAAWFACILVATS